MPKVKSNSAASKRFKLTAAGKVLRRRAYKTHNLEHKTAKRRRSKRRDAGLPAIDERAVKRLLGRR